MHNGLWSSQIRFHPFAATSIYGLTWFPLATQSSVSQCNYESWCHGSVLSCVAAWTWVILWQIQLYYDPFRLHTALFMKFSILRTEENVPYFAHNICRVGSGNGAEQAIIHYLNRWWTYSMTDIYVIRIHWVNISNKSPAYARINYWIAYIAKWQMFSSTQRWLFDEDERDYQWGW